MLGEVGPTTGSIFGLWYMWMFYKSIVLWFFLADADGADNPNLLDIRVGLITKVRG